jgi:hypothetical protein
MGEDLPNDEDKIMAGPQVENTIQPAESGVMTEPQVAEGLPSDQPLSTVDVGESSDITKPESLREQTRARVDKLIDKAISISGVLEASNTTEDDMKLVSGPGHAPTPSHYDLTHRILHEDGSTDFFTVQCAVSKEDPSNYLTISKHVKGVDGSMRSLKIGWENGSDTLGGKLTRIDEKGQTTNVALNPSQTQQTLEAVLDNLQTTLEARGTEAALATDAEVAEILGQSRPAPEV